MTKKLFLFLTVVLGFMLSEVRSSDIAFHDANLLDVETGKTRKVNFGVINGYVSEVSTGKLKARRVFDLRGKFVIPHYWDMHVHFHGEEIKLLKHAEAGVLGVRDMGAFGAVEFDFLRRRAKQKSAFPKMVYAGATHNGKQCDVKQHKYVDSKLGLLRAIDFQEKNGLRFFKLHNCFPMGLVSTLNAEAKKRKLMIVGHIPQGIDPIEYASLRISSIEHIDIILRALMFRKIKPAKSIKEAVEILDGEYLDRLAEAMVENNVALTPTLVTYENYVNSLPEKQKPLGRALFRKLKAYTKRLSEKGVMLLAGTDLGLPGIQPGTSLTRELSLLVDAGLTPIEALRTATSNPVNYLGKHYSPFSKGSKADFIVLDKDPRLEIGSTGSVHGLIKNGRFELAGNSKNK